jgi:3-oxoacyl-[acyl-carrier protein] reductase
MRRQQWGRVINIGYAPAGKLSAFPKCTAYHIAKTGVLIYTKSVAVEEARYHITVNMVSPGTLFNSVKKPSLNPVDYIPAGRFCRYEDVLSVVDYLVGEEASYVTGGHFVVSGGYSI